MMYVTVVYLPFEVTLLIYGFTRCALMCLSNPVLD